MKEKVTENVFDSFGLIEEALAAGPWILGAQYTVADAHLYTIASWLENDGVPQSRLPNVKAHFERMNQRPAVIKAHEIMEQSL
jgi:glutathione S-transferase